MLLLLNLSNTLWCTTVFTWCVDKICKAKCSLFFYAFLVVLCLGGLRWLGVTHVTYLDRRQNISAVARHERPAGLSYSGARHGAGAGDLGGTAVTGLTSDHAMD